MPSADVFSRRFYNAGTVQSPAWPVPAGTTEIRIAIDVEASTTRTVDLGDGTQATIGAIGDASLWDDPANPVCQIIGEGSSNGTTWEECYRDASTWMPIQGRTRIFRPYTHLRGTLTLRSRERLTLRIDYL
jgi:hypothetical protein